MGDDFMSRFIIWEIKITFEILYKIVNEVVVNAITNFQLFCDDTLSSFKPELSTRKSLRQNDVIYSEKTCSSLKTQETFTCSKSIVETIEKSVKYVRFHWRRSGLFIVNFEHILHLCWNCLWYWSSIAIVLYEHLSSWCRWESCILFLFLAPSAPEFPQDETAYKEYINQYKCPEYYGYNDMSFYDIENEMGKHRCQQPSAL